MSLLPAHPSILVCVCFAYGEALPLGEKPRSLRLPHQLLDKIAHFAHVKCVIRVFVDVGEPLLETLHFEGAGDFALADADQRDEVLDEAAGFSAVEDAVGVGIILRPKPLHNPHHIRIILQILKHPTHQRQIVIGNYRHMSILRYLLRCL